MSPVTMPQLARQMGVSVEHVGFATVIPYSMLM